jgi:O-antigen/teichoic acid export membrane protein
MLIDAVSQAACQRLAHFHVTGDNRAFHSLLLKLLGLSAAAAGGGIVVALLGGGPLLKLAYSTAFALQAKTFLWLSVCALPWYCSLVLSYALVARRQTKALFYCQLASQAATLAGAYWLIGKTDLSGACAAVFLTYMVQVVFYSMVMWRVRSGLEGSK